jgi:hypothetical protein
MTLLMKNVNQIFKKNLENLGASKPFFPKGKRASPKKRGFYLHTHNQAKCIIPAMRGYSPNRVFEEGFAGLRSLRYAQRHASRPLQSAGFAQLLPAGARQVNLQKFPAFAVFRAFRGSVWGGYGPRREAARG